ncbi:hypothetical protein [Neisseria arctica]|uniref:hypothetical protein n=1 Tax=Neisseria arctica TaxID=1470200 RepID=UPI00069AE4BD|nr:hypothetical protein [Neisseria arctica]UOO87669.1 hypothetical protein LVJ86_05340 [Neisseria arctica]
MSANAVIKLPPAPVFNGRLADCWQELQGGRSIVVYRSLIAISGNLKTAVMLSQLLYWTINGTQVEENNGWIYKTIDQMEEETGLTKREQGTCKDKLEELKLIERQRHAFGGKLALRVNLDELVNAVCRFYRVPGCPDLNLQTLRSKSSLFFRKYFGKRVAYHRDLVTLTGDIHAAIMLSHIMSESVRYGINQSNPNRHAFASLTINDWLSTIGISYKSQLNARKKLKELGLILEKHFMASRRIFTLADGLNIIKMLKKAVTAQESEKKARMALKAPYSSSFQERAKPVFKKGQNVVNQQVKISEDSHENMTFRSDKRENTEVTKGKIKKLQKGKLRSYKRENTSVTKGKIQ